MTEAQDESFDDLHKKITASLVQTTKAAGQLASQDLDFIRTSNPELGEELNKQTFRILTSARRLVRSAVKGTDRVPPPLKKAEDLEDGWKPLIDIIDDLLEKADVCLDEFTGKVKKFSEQQTTTDENKTRSNHVVRAENILKPQKAFSRPVDNHNTEPFKPLLKTKPHAVIPLEESIASEVTETTRPSYRHPYEHEIKIYRYPSRVYSRSDPKPSQPYDTTSAIWVDTLDGVHAMLTALKSATEIAIDLEHHELRSYTGIVSLMQISTREQDWIVDTLQPWREELQILNEVFADPNIVKVLHGSYMDIVWLQRDLGLYIVGLFDTYNASRSLNYTRHSLAFLLQKFVNFEAQKKFQMADWRTRPLTPEMFDYARSDTHFLLYIFDNMRNELLEKAKGGPAEIDAVLEESKKTCLQRYERSVYDPELGTGDRGWFGLLIKTPAMLDREQFSVFKAVHQWRDQVARKEDESPSYLITNGALFNIARDMPVTLPNLQSHFTRKSDIVISRVSELLRIIQQAKAAGVDGPELSKVLAEHPGTVDYQAKKAARKEHFKKQMASEQQDRSVAAIAQQELFNISGDQLKAVSSSFWGSTVNGAKRIRPNPEAAPPIIAPFQVPLPDFTAEIYTTPGDGIEQTTHPAPPMPEHKYIKKPAAPEAITIPDEGSEQTFTLRDKGRIKKRKHPEHEHEHENDHEQGTSLASSNPSHPSYDPLSGDPNAQTSISSRSSKRRARKKSKAKRDAEAIVDHDRDASGQTAEEDDEEGEDKQDETVFDYASAPSVLNGLNNATTATASAAGGPRHRPPVLNPYAKSMDAPKGLPRKKKEIQGKSATFRN